MFRPILLIPYIFGARFSLPLFCPVQIPISESSPKSHTKMSQSLLSPSPIISSLPQPEILDRSESWTYHPDSSTGERKFKETIIVFRLGDDHYIMRTLTRFLMDKPSTDLLYDLTYRTLIPKSAYYPEIKSSIIEWTKAPGGELMFTQASEKMLPSDDIIIKLRVS